MRIGPPKASAGRSAAPHSSHSTANTELNRASHAVQRERIWRQMFPPEAPLAADVDLLFLARQFELAGGDIRNVVLDAAYAAATASAPIGMRHLLQALIHQLGKQGRAASAAAFKQYWPLVTMVSPGADGGAALARGAR